MIKSQEERGTVEYDYLVVGAGLFGSVFAREMTDSGCRCLVIEKRAHIGGNCYTKTQKEINVHKYGPHVFHTDDEIVWRYVNRFARFNHFINTPKVRYHDRIFSFPINLMTLHQLWGVKTPAEAKAKLDSVRAPIPSPQNMEEWCLANLGEEIYKVFIKGYTKKQWQKDPKELPVAYIQRLPVRMVFDENYYRHRFQGVPSGGYTPIFEKLLDGIECVFGADFLKDRSAFEKKAKKIIYTGRIDEYFDFRHGELEYRALRFDEEEHQGNYQGNAVMNYAEENVPFTRIIEHKHFEFVDCPHTIITKEFPIAWRREEEPYYPVHTSENSKKYLHYKKEADKIPGTIFGGRLAQYEYFDMDQTIGQALKMAKSEGNN